MEIDREMTILMVSLLIFFVSPVAIILTAIIADWKGRTNDHDHPGHDQMTNGCTVTRRPS